MKKFLMILLSTASLLLASFTGLAQGELEVNWENPKDYRDVKPVSQTRSSFRTHIFKELEEFLTKELQAVPDDYKLSLNVTNVDLAGEVWPGMMVGLNSSGDVRLVKRMDIPRMDFTYQLTDASGTVLKEGKEDLKDMSFMERGSRVRDSDPFHYEKNMLQNWFRETFADYIQKK